MICARPDVYPPTPGPCTTVGTPPLPATGTTPTIVGGGVGLILAGVVALAAVRTCATDSRGG